jgi:predicted DNA-binding transcriptional regulator YafY
VSGELVPRSRGSSTARPSSATRSRRCSAAQYLPSSLPMGRTRKPGGPLSRADVVLLVKEHLERAGARGMTKAELVAAIGTTKTSPQTVQRALDELRERYDGQIRYSGRDQRWRLDAPIAMPLDAPDRDDVRYQLIAEAMTEPLLGSFVERIAKLTEDMDELARRRGEPGEIPKRKTMTSTFTQGSRIDLEILQCLHTACRRRAVRIRYRSPWPSASETPTWQEIEPWALRVQDGAVFLRAWARRTGEARTFRLARLEAVEEIADRKIGAPRRTVAADVWDDEAGFGIDYDRPGVAVIRFHGAIARWISSVVWHPCQKDVWLEPDEVLERTIAYRSCRELARRLASVIDGIESIAPRELRDEVFGLFARSEAMSRRRKSTLPRISR